MSLPSCCDVPLDASDILDVPCLQDIVDSSSAGHKSGDSDPYDPAFMTIWQLINATVTTPSSEQQFRTWWSVWRNVYPDHVCLQSESISNLADRLSFIADWMHKLGGHSQPIF